MSRLFLSLTLAATFALSAAAAQPPAGQLPRQIVLNPTTEPATSVAVTWRTADESAGPSVQYAVATAGTSFLSAVTTVPAAAARVTLDTGAVASFHSARLTGLQPATLYVYRVGSEAAWSEWCQVRTAAATAAPFEFVYFGDPQDGLREHCTRLFRTADQSAPAAALWLIAGDLTSEPEDDQIVDFFAAGGAAFRHRLVAPAPGNHDLAFLRDATGAIVRNKKGKKQRSDHLPPTWRAQFTLPENGVPGLEEANYHFDYQGVRFLVLNSNSHLAEQAAWLEPLLAANPNRWTIVAFHHPIYSAGRDRDERETRDALLPLLDRYQVDLVLTGHDHTYARTRPLRAGRPVADGERGTVFVVSSVGSKFYTLSPAVPEIIAQSAAERQLFQRIAVTPERLTYTAIAADGTETDRFELTKP